MSVAYRRVCLCSIEFKYKKYIEYLGILQERGALQFVMSCTEQGRVLGN